MGQPRDLASSHPPEMRIAPTHVESGYNADPVDNRGERKQQKKKHAGFNKHEDSKRKIEVKTLPQVKKMSVKDNPKLTVVTKTVEAVRAPSRGLPESRECSSNMPEDTARYPDQAPARYPEKVSSPEQVDKTIKAIPDSSRHSPDSSNSAANALGYVLEDVSPPSTSPSHPKRDIT